METLEQYRDYFLTLPVSELKIIEQRHYEILTATVMHRSPSLFQVELVVIKPNSRFVAHRHPRIDAFEIYLSGDARFAASENSAEEAEQLLKQSLEIPEPVFLRLFHAGRKRNSNCHRIKPTEWHAGLVGPRGNSFWSIQKWEGPGEITAAGENWEGGPKLCQ